MDRDLRRRDYKKTSARVIVQAEKTGELNILLQQLSGQLECPQRVVFVVDTAIRNSCFF